MYNIITGNNDAKEFKLYIRSTDGLASQNFRIHRWAAHWSMGRIHRWALTYIHKKNFIKGIFSKNLELMYLR